jgi:peptidoglycan/LPS O-acetylase OafA/YrhL
VQAFPYVSWVLGIAAFWWVANHAGLPLGLRDASPAGEWRKHLGYLVYSAFLLLPAVFGPQTSFLHRFLKWKPMVWAGLISYGVYLWHQAWIHQVMLWRGDELFKTPYWQVVLPALVLTFLTATASYWLVEKPFLRLKDRRPRGPVEAREEAVVATAPAP